jgi:hypothetical protein
MASNWTYPGEYERPRYFGGGPGNPPPNPPPPSTADTDVQAAAAAARAAQRKRRGRQSTILSESTSSPDLVGTTGAGTAGGKTRIGD